MTWLRKNLGFRTEAEIFVTGPYAVSLFGLEGDALRTSYRVQYAQG